MGLFRTRRRRRVQDTARTFRLTLLIMELLPDRIADVCVICELETRLSMLVIVDGVYTRSFKVSLKESDVDKKLECAVRSFAAEINYRETAR